LVAAVGIITVNILIGLIIASLGAAAPFAKDPRQDIAYILAVRAIMGAVIAVMGFLTLTGRPLNLQFVQDIISRWEFAKSVYFYGIVYNAAAIGCTGPILLGLMLYAFASGSFVFAITAFGVFSLTMGALMVALTLLTAAFKQAIVGRMARITPLISKIAGAVMVLAGLAIVVMTLEGNNLFVEIFFPYLHETDELAVANESIRLESLASTRDLTPEDLEKLETLTRNHPRLREEFEEVDWMVRHGYQLHAQHSLESIFWIAEGIERFCPAETLSHVRPYLEWDETELALRSAEEAEKEFPEWEIYARGVKEKHPDAFPGLDELLNTMKNVISDVRSGDYSAAKTDAGYLEERGYC
jgi:cytochrome c biogenesis protein CcdA